MIRHIIASVALASLLALSVATPALARTIFSGVPTEETPFWKFTQRSLFAYVTLNGVPGEMAAAITYEHFQAEMNEAGEIVQIGHMTEFPRSFVGNRYSLTAYEGPIGGPIHTYEDGYQISVRARVSYQSADGSLPPAVRLLIEGRPSGSPTWETFETLFVPLNWTEPMTVGSVEPLAPNLWNVYGIEGPFAGGAGTVFSGLVNGRQLDVTLEGFGFENPLFYPPRPVLFGIPEPSAIVLLLISIATCAVLPRRLS